MTVDGFIAGPNGEMDWLVWDWDEKLKQYVGDLTDPVDCIVLGRKLAEGFIPHWAGIAADRDNPEFEVGRKFSDTPKVVFSKKLDKSTWDNAVLAKGDLSAEISNLKKQDGKDIIVYGGAAFVSSLIRERLIDEYYLFINPAAIGKGLAIFHQLETIQNLSLVNSISFECGIVVLNYMQKS